MNEYGLKPKVFQLYLDLKTKCNEHGMDITITEGYRSFERQAALYNQPWDGKDNDGDGLVDEANERVTRAKPGYSMHNYGVAFDVIFVVNGKRTYTGDWDKLGQLGQECGLEWGGSWEVFKDRPHFQYTAGYTINDFVFRKVNWEKFI